MFIDGDLLFHVKRSTHEANRVVFISALADRSMCGLWQGRWRETYSLDRKPRSVGVWQLYCVVADVLLWSAVAQT